MESNELSTKEEAFYSLIKKLPKNLKILDIGCGGLSGENTTNFLIEHFGEKNITGLCRRHPESEAFFENHKAIKIIYDDFYTHKFEEQFDLVVFDLNIEGSLWGWSHEGLKTLGNLVKPGGFFITYIMRTDQYGDPEETPKLIREHWAKWWGEPMFSNESIGNRVSKIKGWEFYKLQDEIRRPYISWTLLKKNGDD